MKRESGSVMERQAEWLLVENQRLRRLADETALIIISQRL
jgi:hypothetical protein